jgi:hypothetical protein
MFQLQKATSDISDKTPAPSQKALVGSIQNKINAIQTGLAQLPTEDKRLYGRSLLQDAQLLKLAANESDPAKTLALLTDVEADLKVKSSAQTGMAMGSRFNGRVKVSVNTRRGSDLVSGYIIVLNPMSYTGADPFIRLEKQSSPASGNAPPGRYQLIAMKNGVQVSRDVVQLGLNAEDAVELDTQVP